jgi:hypothetical protein
MAQYVEGPYIVEDQPDGTRKVVGYVNQQGGQQSNTLITKRASPDYQYAGPKAAADLTGKSLDNRVTEATLGSTITKADADARKAVADAAAAEAAAAAATAKQDKKSQADKLRVAKIEGLLKVIRDAREKADDFLAVGKFSGNAAQYPIVGSLLGQNRATLEGLTDSIMGDLIQQQVAKMAEVNQGGVSSLASTPEEARRMAASIANLSLDQDLPTFLSGLQRAEDYYRRLGMEAGLSEDQINRAVGKKPETPAARMPDMTGGLPTGTNIQFNYAKPDGGFDRTAWLQANFGISPDQEAQITSFMRANRGNPNFSHENLRDYYKAIGAPPPERNDETINAIREGNVNVTGYDSSLAEQLYNMALEKRVAERDTTLGAVDTVGRTAANAFFGAGDRVAAAFGPNDYATNLAAQRFETDAARQANPIAAFGGDVAGLLAGTYTTGALAQNAATRFTPALARQGAWGSSIPRNLANDAFYGTTLAAINDQNPYAAGALALGGSAAGQIIGAPVGRALANTVQSSPRAMQGLNAVSQIFGGRAKPTLPQMSTAQRMMVDAVGDRGPQVLNNLQQAARKGIPMSLADADTGLTALGGAVVRRSPDARNIAINAFEPRAQGQYDRLVGAVERDFGPVANIPQRSEDLIQQARTASRPLYEPLESLPPRTSPALDEMLNTNAGMTAMRNATQIADAQRAPAGSMAIGQDAAGNPVFTATPNFQTLNYVKQGFDRSYETLKRAGDPLAGSINSLRKDYLAEMDNLYPGYAQARAAYAGPAAEREAFQAGVGARNMTPDGLAFAIKDMPEPRLEQFRLGRISDIVDQAGKVKYTANPWNSVVGSPAEQQRLATLFPENAPSFIKQYQLERDIARSQNAILGGSPTAERQLMDQAFQGNLAGDMALDAMTTGAPIKSGLNILGRFGKDELGRIGAEKKAKEIAPVLFDTDAAKAAEAFRKSKKAKKARGIFGRRGARAGASVVSAPIMTSGYE